MTSFLPFFDFCYIKKHLYISIGCVVILYILPILPFSEANPQSKQKDKKPDAIKNRMPMSLYANITPTAPTSRVNSRFSGAEGGKPHIFLIVLNISIVLIRASVLAGFSDNAEFL